MPSLLTGKPLMVNTGESVGDAMLPTRRIIILTFAIILMMLLTCLASQSQLEGQLQLGFNQALIQTRKAEASGATQAEISRLLVLLNRALELNQQALHLMRPEDAGKRAQLLAQVNDLLASIQSQGSQLEITASQRTFMNKVTAYGSAGLAALIATVAYVYLRRFWSEYRIKRTFQMRIVPK